jgi:large subunit ribosomal protein L28
LGRSAANGFTTAIKRKEDTGDSGWKHAEIAEIVLATAKSAVSLRNSLFNFMARICELTGKRPMKGSIIWRSGKPKKQGGIGTHITAITKRKFMPNLQRVKALLPSGEVRYIRVSAAAIKKGLVTKAPKRNWTKPEAVKA